MNILHIASEFAPLAKVGGLGDVVSGLSIEQHEQGKQVTVILPKYDCIDTTFLKDLKVVNKCLPSFYDGSMHSNIIWSADFRGIKIYLIDPQHPAGFFTRKRFYGCDDDIERFLYFSRVALEWLLIMDEKPDIIHLHDWQAAAVAPLYNSICEELGLKKVKVVLTIHNMEHQGRCASHYLDKVGLSNHNYLTSDRMEDPTHHDTANLLKGGIVFSNHVTTVSQRYAQEVLSPTGGRGLENALQQKYKNFLGILNGLDYSYWNPATDPYLPFNYELSSPNCRTLGKKLLDNKQRCKEALRERFGITKSERPIIACVTRLVPQKGIELIKHAMFRSLEQEAQFILIGTSPIPAIHEEFERLKRQMMDHPHLHLNLEYSEELAHLLFAGSDMLIVPSLFEPCGLTQLIALKYGTVPIVRHTGGLADTIVDIDHSFRPIKECNGFSFEFPDAAGVNYALDRAIRYYKNEPNKWKQLMLNGMKSDFSWKNPCEQYQKIYASSDS